MMEIEEDNWLNLKTISCPACEKKLDTTDQSPFDPDCYLYCMECCNRIAIGRYAPHWGLAEEAIREQEGFKDGEMTMGLLAAQFETMVCACPCGGTYRYAAPRRCLYCATVLPNIDPYQHIWPPDPDDDQKALEDGEALIARFSLVAKWLEDS